MTTTYPTEPIKDFQQWRLYIAEQVKLAQEKEIDNERDDVTI